MGNPLAARRAELADPEADECDGLELTLGLSVGGSARKAPDPRSRRRVLEKVEGLRKDGIFGRADDGASEENRAALEAQMLQSRALDRAVKEDEAFPGNRLRPGSTDGGNGSRCPPVAPISNSNSNSHPYPFSHHHHHHHHHHPSSVMYPYHQVQYVSVANGFALPYAMPCWAPTISTAAGGPNRNVYQPLAGRGFPGQATATGPSNGSMNGGTGIEAADGGDIAVKADSTGSSSSAISDHPSGSIRGGSISSGDSRINTSPQKAEKPAAVEEGANNKLVSSTAQSGLMSNTKPSGFLGGLERAASVNKPVTAASRERIAKNPSPLPRMPLVSTTGNGPNGRTINGFLYRYTKSEVRILCVCHGRSFTPTEFVRHAGGTNISQPLRQIVVVTS